MMTQIFTHVKIQTEWRWHNTRVSLVCTVIVGSIVDWIQRMQLLWRLSMLEIEENGRHSITATYLTHYYIINLVRFYWNTSCCYTALWDSALGCLLHLEPKLTRLFLLIMPFLLHCICSLSVFILSLTIQYKSCLMICSCGFLMCVQSMIILPLCKLLGNWLMFVFGDLVLFFSFHRDWCQWKIILVKRLKNVYWGPYI